MAPLSWFCCLVSMSAVSWCKSVKSLESSKVLVRVPRQLTLSTFHPVTLVSCRHLHPQVECRFGPSQVGSQEKSRDVR